MAFGFQSFTDDNTIQIDELTPCLQLATKGQLTVSPGTNNAHLTAFLYYTSMGGGAPIVAIRVPEDRKAYATITGAQRSGNNWTFKIAMDNHPGELGTYVVDYYIFDKPTVATGSYGLSVYDASGNLTFSSQQQPLIVETRPATYDSTRLGWVVDDTRTYALALCAGYGYREQEYEISTVPPTYYWAWEQNVTMGYNILGGYRVDIVGTAGGEGFAPDPAEFEMAGDFDSGSANVLLIDVTGI